MQGAAVACRGECRREHPASGADMPSSAAAAAMAGAEAPRRRTTVSSRTGERMALRSAGKVDEVGRRGLRCEEITASELARGGHRHRVRARGAEEECGVQDAIEQRDGG